MELDARKWRFYLDEIRVVLKKKKHQYQKQILIYLIEILAMFFIIFFVTTQPISIT